LLSSPQLTKKARQWIGGVAETLTVEECILDLSSAELNICEIISKDLGVDPVVEALRPFHARYLEEENIF
jgi:hypothetical protein